MPHLPAPLVSRRYVIQNAEVWNADRIKSSQDVWVQDGKVEAIVPAGSRPLGDTQGISANGHVLMPAGVDCQVHLRVPGQTQKETALTGMHAALRGGVGAVLTMPNTVPVIDTPDVCAYARRELSAAEEATGVKVFLSAALTRDQKGREPVDFDALVQAGVKAFTDDGHGVARDELMNAAFAASARLGFPVLQHAEVAGHGGILAEGPVQRALGLKAYPEAAEVDMVARDLEILARHPKARYHVLHVSSERTLQLVHEAKFDNLLASCEVTPHHLLFCADDIRETNTAFKMNPPLRSDRDRHALRQALSDGLCDFVSTDHAPHEAAVKVNFKTAAFGTTALEASLRVLITLMQQQLLTPTRLVQVFAKNPARFLGIEDDFGTIAVDKPFHATLVDVKAAPAPLTEAELAGQAKNSCFTGTPLGGRIIGTFLMTKIHRWM